MGIETVHQRSGKFDSCLDYLGPQIPRDLSLPGGHGREQRDEPLYHRGVREDSVTQHGIGQSCKHRDLDDCDDFSCFRSESSEPKNAITLGID
jgi:hypothetical protein